METVLAYLQQYSTCVISTKLKEELWINKLTNFQYPGHVLSVFDFTNLRYFSNYDIHVDLLQYSMQKKIPTTLLFIIFTLNQISGTYVKEFVHGDLGRTVPSVCSLLDCQVNYIIVITLKFLLFKAKEIFSNDRFLFSTFIVLCSYSYFIG